ncbi:MAG: tetraacyldisaccharide 4'-kinase [Terracidiphilus sp.]|jgi:tetraacyldisaccharide 4'-kinase
MSQTSFARRLLFPLIPLYRLALAFTELRFLLEPARRLRFPVISIGNLSTGGAGKTPLTITLAKALKKRGLRVDVLSRGYGRQSSRPDRVRDDGTAAEFGDEPLLIAYDANVPVYVAARRYDAGVLAEAEVEAVAIAGSKTEVQEPDKLSETAAEATPSNESLTKEARAETEKFEALPPLRVHLLDDGFQHRQLDRAVNILMLNQRDWRDWLLPAGNLREPIEAARRASVIAIPANEPELEAELCVWGWSGPIWHLHRKMEIPLVNSPIAAFCGIARPEQFFAGLEAIGLEVPMQIAFPDHFSYTHELLEELIAEAQEKEATAILTTEKDLVRLGRLVYLFPKTMPLAVARLRIEIDEQKEAIDWLVERLRAGL